MTGPLAPRTLKLRRNQIHAAVTALVKSGVSADSIAGLGDLVRLDHFRKILRHRFEEAGRKPNNFNRDLAEALIQIAREWVKADPADLAELKRLSGKMPMLPKGLTPKNNRSVAQFDDPEAVRRLLDLPAQLWIEVRRDPKPNFRTLARAQAALAIAMLTYMPVRSHNLHELMFGKHLFLHDGARATSSLEIPADEVKEQDDWFDLRHSAEACEDADRVPRSYCTESDRLAARAGLYQRRRLPQKPRDGRAPDQDLPQQAGGNRNDTTSVSTSGGENYSRRPAWCTRTRAPVPGSSEPQDDDRFLRRFEHAPGWIASPTPD